MKKRIIFLLECDDEPSLSKVSSELYNFESRENKKNNSNVRKYVNISIVGD